MMPRPKLPVPRPRLFQLKPRQLPTGKRMTIGIGILASDGVVIAADTQESIQGYWKTNQGKVRWSAYQSVDHGSGSIVVTGAGTARHLDAIQDQLTAEFVDAHQVDVEGWARKVIKDFHVEHVVPFTVDTPQASLLMAASLKTKDHLWGPYLWATEKTAVVKYEHFAAVGIGSGHAVNLLNRLWRYDALDVRATAILAAYVIFHVKDYVDGCGNFTDVAVIKNDRVYTVRREQITELESLFRLLTGETEALLASYLFNAAPDGKIEKLSRSLRSARTKFLDILKKASGPYNALVLQPTRQDGSPWSEPPLVAKVKRQKDLS